MSYNYGYSGYAGSPFGRVAPDYIIRKSGTNYLAESRFDHIPLRDTSLHDLWDSMNSDTTSPVIEFSRGSFEVDGELDIQADDTVVRGQGPQATELKLGNGVDTNVFAQNTYHHNTYIGDLTIHGNRDNNTVGMGIDFNPGACTYSGTSQYWGWYHVNNIQICECDEDAAYFRSTSGTHVQSAFTNFRTHDNDGGTTGHDISFTRLWDQWIGGGAGQANCRNIRFNQVSNSIVNNVYSGVGAPAYPNLLITGSGAGIQFHNCHFDNSSGNGIVIESTSKRNQFTGCAVTNFDQDGTTNTYDAVSLEDDTMYNTFTGCFFGHTDVTTGDRWKYAFHEIDNADYNMFLSCYTGYGANGGGNAEHFATDEYLLNAGAGAHTTVENCFKHNGAAWNT